MNKKIYSSSMKKTPFVYIYSKKIGKIIKDGIQYKDAYDLFVNNKKLDIISDERRREVFNVIYERLSTLDTILLDSFIDGNITTSKFILLYAITKNDLLFLKFLLLYYRPTLIENKNYISISDFDDFFTYMKEQNSIVNNWSDNTIRQLSGGYRNVIVESGIGYRNKKNIIPNKVIVDPYIVKHIKEIGDKEFLRAVLGVE